MSLSSVTVLDHNTLLSKNVLQSWDISYMIHEVISYFIMLQLIVPVKTEYSYPRYVSSWTNESMKHFKLIVLRFSCLIVIYARSEDSFHRNQASGHVFRVVSSLRGYVTTILRGLGDLCRSESITGRLVSEEPSGEATQGRLCTPSVAQVSPCYHTFSSTSQSVLPQSAQFVSLLSSP